MAARSPPSPACSSKKRSRVSGGMAARAMAGCTTPFFFTSRRGQSNTVLPCGMSHRCRSSSRPSRPGTNADVSMKFISALTDSARSGTRFTAWW